MDLLCCVALRESRLYYPMRAAEEKTQDDDSGNSHPTSTETVETQVPTPLPQDNSSGISLTVQESSL